jgi:hypothetical protein
MTWIRTATALGGAAALLACEPARPVGSDELTIVVQADRRELDAQEKALKSREEALKSEQGQLDDRIRELASSRAAADFEHRRRLDEELQRAKAAQDELGKRVQVLQQQKISMEAQRTVLDVPQAPGSTSQLSVRETMVAAREAKVATRESHLAGREAELGAREKSLLAREEKLAERAALLEKTVKAAPPALAKPELMPEPPALRDVPTRAAVEGRHKKLMAEMETRGLLISDLAAEDQPLNAGIFSARRQGDYARAADLLSDLQRAVAKLRIDQRFVEAKMVRLQGQRAGARLADGQRSEVEQLLRDVTSSYSDGRYEKANQGLNRIAAILDASHASG